MTTVSTRDRRSGVVLAMVLVMVLLLVSAIAPFLSRVVIDRTVVSNREASSRAESLARGGVEIAIGLLMQDSAWEKLPAAERPEGFASGASHLDLWSRFGRQEIVTPEGDSLRVTIEDAGARLNLNALVPRKGSDKDAIALPDSEEFLVEFFQKVIDEMPIPPGESELYDARELARNLLDYLDSDEDSRVGSFEDDYYQQQDPPYTAANRPLLSVDELLLVKDFDAPFVDALRPYLTVYPPVGAQGVNLNTAPAHVLATVYSGTSGDKQLLNEDDVRQLLQLRDEDRMVCRSAGEDHCITLTDLGFDRSGMFPAATLPARPSVFLVTAVAQAGKIQRRIEAVVDRRAAWEEQLLSWRAY